MNGVNSIKEIPINPELPLLIERLGRGLDMYREHTYGIQGKLKSLGQQQDSTALTSQESKSPENALDHIWQLCNKLESINDDLLGCYKHLERII